MNTQGQIVGVCGRESHYAVSDHGGVYALKDGKVRRQLRPGKNSSGYLGVVLARGGSKRWVSVHRLVASAFVPNPEGLPIVNHIDGDRLNNNASNLEWCTAKQNTQHARDAGTILRGKDHPKASACFVTWPDGSCRTFDTARDAAAATGIPYPTVVLYSKLGKTIRGFSFSRLD